MLKSTRQASLVLVNGDWAVNNAHAISPHVLYAEALTAKRPEPLTGRLAEFVESAGDAAVVYASLGSTAIAGELRWTYLLLSIPKPLEVAILVLTAISRSGAAARSCSQCLECRAQSACSAQSACQCLHAALANHVAKHQPLWTERVSSATLVAIRHPSPGVVQILTR